YITDILSFFTNYGHNFAKRNGITFISQYLKNRSGIKDFNFHGGFVRFHFGNYITGFYLIAFLNIPLSDDTLLHRITKLGHFNFYSHNFSYFKLNRYQKLQLTKYLLLSKMQPLSFISDTSLY